MATRSTIAIQNQDGTVTAIYCHWDGYPSHNGRILQENYTTEAQVRELLALGDLSSLGETIGEKVDFDDYDSHKGQCVAYGRDRGESGVDQVIYRNYKSVEKQAYNYLFDPENGKWQVNGRDLLQVLEYTTD